MTSRFSLRNRLVLLMLAAMIPLFALSMVRACLNADIAVSRVTDDLKFAASLVAVEQGRVVDSARQLLMSIVNVPGLVNPNHAECKHYLSQLKSQLAVYTNLGIIGTDGYILCNAVGTPNVFVGDRDFVQEALLHRKFTVGGYVLGRQSGKPVIVFLMPVIDSKGQLAALAFASMNLGELSSAVGNTSLPQGSQVAVMDRQGTVLTASPPNPALIGKKTPSPLLQDAVKTMRTGIGESVDSEGSQRIFAFLPADQSPGVAFFVAFSANKDHVLAPVEKQLMVELLALMVLAFLGGAMAWVIGGRAIVKPTTEILEAIRQLRKGQLDTRIPVRSLDGRCEFGKIAVGFNRMAESLQAHSGALEAELARSQAVREKLQDAQRLARLGYWQIQTDTHLVSWSEEVYEVLGVDRAFFDGTYDGFLKHVHRGDHKAFNAARNAAFEAGKPLDVEFRIVTSLGKVRWIHQFDQVHGNGEPAKTASRSGVIQDITERKHAELAIARNTELLNRTGALARVGGWEVVMDTMTPYWSEEFYRIHELDPGQELCAEDAINFYAPDVQPVFRAALQAARTKAIPWDMELPLTTSKGRHIWVRVQGNAVLQDGKVIKLVGALQDITAQHQSQQHLRLLEASIACLNDMVMITGAEPFDEPGPRIVFVNDAFERRTGYSLEEVRGKSPRFLQGPNTQRAELQRISVALRKCQSVRSELINYTKSGQEFWVELDIVPISDEKGCFTHWVAVERDITLRKLADQALLDSEQRYAALFEFAPVPMWIYDLATTRFLAVNSAAVKEYGYSVAEFLSMTIFDIRPEPEHEHLRQWLGNPARKSAVWHDRRKDNSLFAVETVSQPIQYAGRAARFVVAVDKTAQVKAEKEVHEYLFTLQRSADAAQAITWHRTLEGTMQEIAEQARGVIRAHQSMVSLNRSSGHAQTFHGVSLSEKYAKYRGLDEPADGTGIYAMVCESNRSIRLTQAELETHPRWRGFGQHADNHPAMRGWLAIPLVGRNGENIGLLQLSDKHEGDFTQQDEYVAIELAHLASAAIENSRLLEEVSELNASLEQKVIERTVALTRQEALFRALADQAPQAVWTKDPNGALTYFNRAWCALVGGTQEDWIGSTQWYAAVHPEELLEVKARWDAAVASRSEYAGIRRLRAKDGSYHTMAYRASPVLDEQGAVAFWVGIDADITEIKAIEAALRLSNQELEAFSYSVSHDLRSPLNTIDGFSRLLAKQLAPQLAGDAGEKVKHYLSRIQAGVAQMGQLIEDLLSLSQVTRAQLRTEPVDLSVMAHSLMDGWQAHQPERQVAVSIESGLHVEADGGLVRVALENLLANAWKFSSQQVLAEITVGQKLDAAGLPVFFVRDNGAGFDMAYADKLFDPFQRLHAASEFSGTGIGLATVSRVIARHGGRIWAESAIGHGATFFFTLPAGRRTA